MTFDHVLAVLKLILAPLLGAIVKREKAPMPVAVTPSSALALNFDSKDIAIFCLGVALVFSTLAVISLAAARR